MEPPVFARVTPPVVCRGLIVHDHRTRTRFFSHGAGDLVKSALPHSRVAEGYLGVFSEKSRWGEVSSNRLNCIPGREQEGKIPRRFREETTENAFNGVERCRYYAAMRGEAAGFTRSRVLKIATPLDRRTNCTEKKGCARQHVV